MNEWQTVECLEYVIGRLTSAPVVTLVIVLIFRELIEVAVKIYAMKTAGSLEFLKRKQTEAEVERVLAEA